MGKHTKKSIFVIVMTFPHIVFYLVLIRPSVGEVYIAEFDLLVQAVQRLGVGFVLDPFILPRLPSIDSPCRKQS